jgi:hypothetical protein
LFEAGRFQPECPLCRQVDESLQPSATALAALQEIQQYYADVDGASERSQDENGEADEEGINEEEEVQSEEDAEDEDSEVDDCEEDSDDDGGDMPSDSEDDSGSSDGDSSSSGGDDDNGMEVDSDVGSSVASSALTAVAAHSAAVLEPEL